MHSTLKTFARTGQPTLMLALHRASGTLLAARAHPQRVRLAPLSAGMSRELNVLGQELQPCGAECGFQRDGYCSVPESDMGNHSVASEVTADFLEYTKTQGNDLSTPRPPMFKGLKPGDRWKQAKDAGKAPKVVLASTSEKALKVLDLDLLKQYAA